VRTIPAVVVLLCATSCLVACGRARTYEVRGQVLAVDRERHEITIAHEDIRGLMPGMTMPFKVKDAKLLDGSAAGDLVKATLVVEDSTAHLTSIVRTGHTDVVTPPPAPYVDVLEPGAAVPDVNLVDETGTARTLRDWKGRIVAVTFTYTRCPLPDFCPKMDRQFESVQRDLLADPGLRDRVALLSVSFDPAYDTPPVLAAHASRSHADPRIWHFVTGKQEEIAAFAARFGTSVIRDAGNAADITHNLRTAVIASDGTLVTIFKGNEWTPGDLLAALRQAH
jgi:protein SCO1/2